MAEIQPFLGRHTMLEAQERVLARFRADDDEGRGLISRGRLKWVLARLANRPVGRINDLLDQAVGANTDAIDYVFFLDWLFKHEHGMASSSFCSPLSSPLKETTSGMVSTNADSYPCSIEPNEERNAASQWQPWMIAKRLSHLHVHRSKEESMLIGVSIAWLASGFSQEVEENFGVGANPNYYEINARMLCGPNARGAHYFCPRDSRPGCSYVDALDPVHVGPANIMLSWTWQYKVRSVVDSLAQWCKRNSRDPAKTFIWQCALCNNQFRVEEKKARNETEPFESFRICFQSRVNRVGHILALVSPWRKPLYVERIWCVFELWACAQSERCKLELLMTEEAATEFREDLEQDGMAAVWKTFGRMRIEHAKASVEQDRVNILRLVDSKAKDEQDYENSQSIKALNLSVIHRLQVWCVETALEFVTGDTSGPSLNPIAHANAAWLLQETAQWDQAYDVLRKGLDALKQMEKTGTAEHAWLLKSMGACELQKGCLDEALSFFSQAKSIYQTVGAMETREYARLTRKIGNCDASLGRYQEALTQFAEAKAAYEASSDMGPHYAVCLRSMGSCQIELGNFAEAIDLLVGAQSAFLESGSSNTPNYACVLRDLGLCSDKRGHIPEALDYFDQAKAVFEKIAAKKSKHYAALLRYLGQCHTQQGKTEEARTCFLEAKFNYEAVGASKTPDYAVLLAAMAEHYEVSGDLETADILFLEAKGVYEETGAESREGYDDVLRYTQARDLTTPSWRTPAFSGTETLTFPRCESTD